MFLSSVKYSSPPLPDHVFEADIALTSDQKRNIDLFGNVGRGASKDTNLRWPDGIIPYEIDCSLRKCIWENNAGFNLIKYN